MYKETFTQECINGPLLLELDESILEEELGISLKLHRIKLLAIINGRISVSKFNQH